MDRGENVVRCFVPLKAMLPLTDYQAENRIGSKSQAANQILCLFLHEHGFMTDEDLAAIKEETKVFRKDQDFIEEKMIQYRETIEQKKTVEFYIPGSDLKYLKQIQATLRTLPYEKYADYVSGYRKAAERYEHHPIAKKILEH